jgi:hypothetical protein
LISNTTIPKIYKADFWDKNKILVQYIDRNQKTSLVKTYSIKLSSKSTLEQEIENRILGKTSDDNKDTLLNFDGVPFPTGIENYSILPNSNKIFYLKKKSETETVGVITDNFGNNK